MSKEKECLFCGCCGLRQPAIPKKLNLIFKEFPPFKTPVPFCEYHLKLFEDWGTDEEFATMERIKLEYLRRSVG